MGIDAEDISPQRHASEDIELRYSWDLFGGFFGMQDISSSFSKRLSFEGHLKFQRKKGRYQASPVRCFPSLILLNNSATIFSEEFCWIEINFKLALMFSFVYNNEVKLPL